jgi:glycosyltransferase involved in cell wall biosynthesis
LRVDVSGCHLLAKAPRAPGLTLLWEARERVMQPLVSICIPTYQGSRWVHDSTASALAQDYPNVEVVISDDASTDGTAEIAAAIADGRVRVARSDRRLGMAGNWNRSVQLARGEYVKLLMQDDLLAPSCVSRMADVLSRNPSVGFVFSRRTIEVDDPADAGAIRLARKLERLPGRLGALGEVNDGRAIFHAMRRTGFRGNWIGEPTAVMVRRDALDRVGLFNTRLRQLTDLELWLRLAFFFDVGFVPEALATFRLHATSTTSANAAAGDAWLDWPWLVEGLRQHPEIRGSLGPLTEAKVWAVTLGAEGKRLVTHVGRGRPAYASQLREYRRYRSRPTGPLHGRLDAVEPAETTGRTS